MPTYYITLVSSDYRSVIAFTAGGTLSLTIAQQSGLAHSLYAAIPVNLFPPALWLRHPAQFSPVSSLLTLSPMNSTIVADPSTSTSCSGSYVDQSKSCDSANRNFRPDLYGRTCGDRLWQSTDISQKTTVGIIVKRTCRHGHQHRGECGQPVEHPLDDHSACDTRCLSAIWQRRNRRVRGPCNPSGSICTVLPGTAVSGHGLNTIIRGGHQCFRFLQVSPGGYQHVVSYDLISAFGSNFCSSGGTGCGSNSVLSASPDTTYRFFPTTLTWMPLSHDSGPFSEFHQSDRRR